MHITCCLLPIFHCPSFIAHIHCPWPIVPQTAAIVAHIENTFFLANCLLQLHDASAAVPQLLMGGVVFGSAHTNTGHHACNAHV
jgi:hypothetical protein